VQTPWRRDGDGWRTDLDGRYATEHLIAASIGLGGFQEQTVRIGGHDLVLAFEGGILPDARARAAHAIEQVARYVDLVFGLRATYRVIIVPPAPDGEALEGEGWATGQGGTLAPPDPARLARFAQRLIEARTTHAPYRTELADPAELWLVEGLTRLYSWRALTHTAWADDRAVAEDYADAYVEVLRTPGLEMNLEKVYESHADPTAVLELVGPTALLCLERVLDPESRTFSRAGHDSVGGLDAMVHRVFASSGRARFWAALPGDRAAPGEDFRRRFVQGREALPVETLAPVPPLASAPDSSGGPAVRRLTLAYTGNTFGYLENCGCKVNQSGGMARRAAAIATLRRRDPGTVLLDAGNCFVRVDERHQWDAFTHAEQHLYLDLMSRMRYDAAAIGPAELAFGADTFAAVARDVKVPWVTANVRGLDSAWIAPWRLVRSRGLKIAVIGVSEPPRGWRDVGVFRRAGAAMAFGPVLDALTARVGEARANADLVVVIGRLRPATIRALAAQVPGIDAVISTNREAVSLTTEGQAPLLLSDDEPGFVGHTAVLYTTLDSYGLGVAHLDLDHENRVVAAPTEELWFDDKVPDDRSVRAALDRFYQGAGRAAAGEAQVAALFPQDVSWMRERFAGAARCSTCHTSEYQQWQSTAHAGAFKTLLDVHRHYQPRCVACHVVGFGTAHGYRIEGGDQRLAGVQCEVCHGPGAAHAQRPAATNIRRAVPEPVCLTCHDAMHSERFVYSEKLPLVVHARPRP
jgi:hypothetical protein